MNKLWLILAIVSKLTVYALAIWLTCLFILFVYPLIFYDPVQPLEETRHGQIVEVQEAVEAHVRSHGTLPDQPQLDAITLAVYGEESSRQIYIALPDEFPVWQMLKAGLRKDHEFLLYIWAPKERFHYFPDEPAIVRSIPLGNQIAGISVAVFVVVAVPLWFLAFFIPVRLLAFPPRWKGPNPFVE